MSEPSESDRRIGPRERERRERAARRHEFGRPDITELEIGSKTHKVADVEPMDVNGVRTMTVGTIIWAVAVVSLLPFIGKLQELHHMWWLWTCLAGLGLGLIGLEYCRRRRNALQMRPGQRKG